MEKSWKMDVEKEGAPELCVCVCVCVCGESGGTRSAVQHVEEDSCSGEVVTDDSSSLIVVTDECMTSFSCEWPQQQQLVDVTLHNVVISITIIIIIIIIALLQYC